MEEACSAVGLDPGLVLSRDLHQLSGGQRRRLIVARALMLSPKLLIADELVSILDASLRATILSNIYDLKDKYGISILYITHGLPRVRLLDGAPQRPCLRGRPPKEVIGAPKHPYTQLLIDSIPWSDFDCSWGTKGWDPDAMRDEAEKAPAVLRGGIEGFELSKYG